MNNKIKIPNLELENILADYLQKNKIHTTGTLPILESFTVAQGQTKSIGATNSLMIIQIISNSDDSKLYFDGVQINPSFEPERYKWFLVNKVELKNTAGTLNGQVIGYKFLLD